MTRRAARAARPLAAAWVGCLLFAHLGACEHHLGVRLRVDDAPNPLHESRAVVVVDVADASSTL